MPGRRPFTPKGKSLTKQAFGEQSDINTIVGKFLSTGSLDWFNRLQPRFGDFSGVEDYHSCLNRVVEAQQAFDTLPARVRAYFNNDPAELVEAAHDPARAEELRAIGLIPLGEPAPPLPPGEESDDEMSSEQSEGEAPSPAPPPPKPSPKAPRTSHTS